MRLLAFCVMPNRWHLAHGTVGTRPLYQGRFKSFPIQEDEHFFTVCRYVERNALRANPVTSAEQWRWSSLWHESTGAPRLALPSAKRSGSRPRRSVWDWNPRYVPLAAPNTSVPTGEPSRDAANRHK